VFDSESVYSRLKEEFEKRGIIMLLMKEAVKKYPDLVKNTSAGFFNPKNTSSPRCTMLCGAEGGVYMPKRVRIHSLLRRS